MNRPLFVESDPAVEVAGCAQEVKATSLSIVAFVCLINIRLSENEDLSAERVPLDLGALRLEECLLTGRRRTKCSETEDLDTGRLTLHET